jgi:spermidine synthase
MEGVYAAEVEVKAGGRRRAPRVGVRRVPGGRELRVDGTFASWYRPGSPVTGSVWDAIAAPLLALPPRRRRSVLLLGLGGGSAARLVRALAPRARIVAVELSAEVVRTARRWFDLDELGLELEIADAHAFLARDRRRYDLVLEDVFVGVGEAVFKPPWLPTPGLALAARRLAPGGLLVSNALDEAPFVARALRDLFPRVVRIDVDEYDNRVFVGGPGWLAARPLRRAVAAHPLLAEALPRLAFRTVASRGRNAPRQRARPR